MFGSVYDRVFVFWCSVDWVFGLLYVCFQLFELVCFLMGFAWFSVLRFNPLCCYGYALLDLTCDCDCEGSGTMLPDCFSQTNGNNLLCSLLTNIYDT